MGGQCSYYLLFADGETDGSQNWLVSEAGLELSDLPDSKSRTPCPVHLADYLFKAMIYK